MQKFWFHAVNTENQPIYGTMYAGSQAEATEKLRGEGLAVLVIEIYDEKKHGGGEDKKQFEFLATTEEGEKKRGTIESKSEYEAYKKLVIDYNLNLQYLIDMSLDLQAREAKKNQGIDPTIIEQFQRDPDAQKLAKNKKEERDATNTRSETDEILERREKDLYFVREEIENIIQKVQELLKKNEMYLDMDKKREITDHLNTLSRLRRSNSIGHLKTITKKVFDSLQDDALFLASAGLSDAEQAEKKSEFDSISMSLEKNMNTGLSKMQQVMSSIDTSDMVNAVQNIRPIKSLIHIITFAAASTLGLSMIFWVYQFILSRGSDPVQADFFFHSAPLWFLTGLSALIVAIMGIRYYGKKKLTFFPKAAFWGIASILLIAFVLFFPRLFFWTH